MRTPEQMYLDELAGIGPRTDREMDISQVAGILTEGWPGGCDLREWASRINDGSGWSYECCYPSQQPYSEGWYTQVAGRHLGDDDLEIAVQMAVYGWTYRAEQRAKETRLAAEAQQRQQERAARRAEAQAAYHKGNNTFGPGRLSGEELRKLESIGWSS